MGGTIKKKINNSKMIDLNSTITIMTLSINVITTPMKGQRLSNWVYRMGKSRFYSCEYTKHRVKAIVIL